jgi:hypothetical protein
MSVPETDTASMMIARRRVLAILGLGCAASLWSRPGEATLVRGLTLEVLARGSDRIIVGTAVEASSRWVNIGSQRRIVTDTRVRVDRTISGSAGSDILVRTHGGRIGSFGQLVHGEPELVLSAPCVLFLRWLDGVHYVLGTAQGHYPLLAGTQRSQYLKASPRLPQLLHPEQSAVRSLAGRELGQALQLVRKALES